jgi:hypothetical protein
MNGLLLAVLLPLHFTAPADTLGMDAAGRPPLSSVHEYVFQQLDANDKTTVIPGYADSVGSAILTPHAPGTRETVWLAPGANRSPVTIYVLSLDASGKLIARSNGSVLAPRSVPWATRSAAWTALNVPIVEQAPERCGEAALAMVLRYYGAAPTALREVDGVFNPAVAGSRIDDLADAARRAGYDATVAALTPDSLIELLSDGVPPILLYRDGSGPAAPGRFGVVTEWDASQASFTLNDGTARRRVTRRDDLVKQWTLAGSLALIVRERAR